ncbi:MAG: tRNA (adenosine(37)-N6)-threonylcarbamoyltransferase complex dimerization subunit type 1 TsaB, partial [Chloroflexota bacterium]|nr:tRNA (adenosine(37)-N6)-threonylcarbamoyltransferase complex dimerization subunit type 1 TsaB [Chloroflexota bacterium]
MLLAIDTSTSWISLALYDGVSVRYELTWQSQHHHTVELAPAIEQLFTRTGTSRQDLTGLAVAIGPGSFTSLRIGVAVIKGFSLALKLPIVGIASLDVVTAAQPLDDRPLIAVLHAGRTRLAYATYKVEDGSWLRESDPSVIDPKDLVKTIKKPTLIC